MVLADLGRKITSALQSLSKATVINEEVWCIQSQTQTIKFEGDGQQRRRTLSIASANK